jgi:hypothetical protein
MQFQTAIQALCDGGVEFVVIGGVSATLHGSAQVTYDLHICYSRASVNLERLASALAPFHTRPTGFPEALPFLWEAGTLRNASILTLQTDIGEIDLLAEVAGVGDFGEVRAHSILVDAFGREIATLDLPGLIRSKRAAGRPKDLSTLAELESLLEAGESQA